MGMLESAVSDGQGHLKLLVPQRHAQEPNLAIQWCISRELIARLEQEGVLNPCLLICVTDEHGYENVGMRRIVPLDQVQERIAFHRPGVHTIHACVLRSDIGAARLRASYLRTHWDPCANQIYERDVFNRNGREMDLDVQIDEDEEGVIDADAIRRSWTFAPEVVEFLALAMLQVYIMEDHFAPPLPKTLQWWLAFPNGMSQLRDECHMRGKVLFALTVKPLFVLIASTWICAYRALKALVWTVLCAARGADWNAVLHPFAIDSPDILPERKDRMHRIAFGLAFYRGESDLLFHLMTPFALLLMPATWLFGFAVAGGLSYLIGTTFQSVLQAEAMAYVVLSAIVMGIMVLGAIVALIGAACKRSGTRVGEWLRNRSELKEIERERKIKEEIQRGVLEDRFDDLVCTSGRVSFRPITQLPKRPVVLFSELKAKVCKPYPKP